MKLTQAVTVASLLAGTAIYGIAVAQDDSNQFNDAANAAAEDMSNAADEAQNAVEDAANEAAENAEEMVNDAEQTAQEAVEEAAGEGEAAETDADAEADVSAETDADAAESTDAEGDDSAAESGDEAEAGAEADAAADDSAAEATDEADTSTEGDSAESDADTGETAEGEAAESAPQVTRETFDDWEVQCIEGTQTCVMNQVLEDENGNPVVEVSIRPLQEDGEADAGLVIMTPLGTLLTEGLSLQIDSSQTQRYPYSYCNRDGCIAQIGLPGNAVTAFKRGNVANVGLRAVAAPQQAIDLDMSLAGFTAAYDSMTSSE
ncbi:invasion associated locus B family protein [Paracoccaceae bacterium GXU_MW_L88]